MIKKGSIDIPCNKTRRDEVKLWILQSKYIIFPSVFKLAMKQLVFPILDFIFDHMVQLTEVILAEPDAFFYVLAKSFLGTGRCQH